MTILQGKYWMFTHFDMQSETPETFLKDYEYLIYQLEKCPESGRYHYQGYVAFVGKKKLTTLKSFNPTTHWDRRRGTHSQAKAYASKEESKIAGPWEFGTDDEITEGQGSRSDLVEIKRMIDEQEPLMKVAEEHFSDWVRYNKSFTLYKDMKDTEITKKELKIEYSAVVLRDWQTRAFAKLSNQSNRGVLWIWDAEGNKGKSFFARWLEAVKGAYMITSGKHSDIYYAYDGEPIVVLDLARTHSMDKSLYEIIEGFKNGRVFSSKYQSKKKIFKSAQVCVCANFPPDLDMISHDRIEQMELK